MWVPLQDAGKVDRHAQAADSRSGATSSVEHKNRITIFKAEDEDSLEIYKYRLQVKGGRDPDPMIVNDSGGKGFNS
jgi:hypothetical protein